VSQPPDTKVDPSDEQLCSSLKLGPSPPVSKTQHKWMQLSSLEVKQYMLCKLEAIPEDAVQNFFQIWHKGTASFVAAKWIYFKGANSN
jgi:hypothetical protein